MKQSFLFTKTSKTSPKDETSLNAELLIKAGFVDKLMAGTYSYLPLGYLVLNKIKDIIRQEMNNIDGQEIYMPALTPKTNWQTTGRWDDPGTEVMFQFKGRSKKEYGLGWTHEEIVTPLVKKFVNSYKDLPLAVYQIQDKFRNEPRAKSGLMRGIEFSMKDLYSFHANEKCLEEYYEKSKQAYLNIFNRCDLDALIVEASGGSFSKYSHEFQVATKFGEDDIYYCPNCQQHQNKEVITDKKCPYCQTEREIKKAIEVGNIFKLKTKYSEAFNLKYTNKNGQENLVLMGCYGMGPSRIMGAIVEIHHDDKGIIWPKEIAPFQVHLLNLSKDSTQANEAYNSLQKHGIEVLYDDRDERAGTKFNDADLIGIPVRLVISDKTDGKIEYKLRQENETKLITLEEVLNKVKL